MSEFRKNAPAAQRRTAVSSGHPANTQKSTQRTDAAVKRTTTAGAKPGTAAAAGVKRPVSAQGGAQRTGQAVKKTAGTGAGSAQTARRTANEWTSEAKAPRKKDGGFLQDAKVFLSDKLKLDFLAQKEINWQVLVAASVSVVILIGILAMLILGIGKCSGGCSGSEDKVKSEQKLQIHQSATPAPQNTPGTGTQNTNVLNNDPVSTPAPEATIVPAINVIDPTTNVNTEGLRSATIRSIGDFVIHKELIQASQRLAKSTSVSYGYNFAPMLNHVWDVIGNADFTVANVDGCLGGQDSYKYGYSGYPQFNTPEYILYALRDSSVDMLTLANNHMLDGWYDGLMKTIRNVEYVDIKHVGASRSKEERNSPVIYEINGIKVGFMNYTQSLNGMDRANGLDPRAMEFAVHATSNSNCVADAKKLREAGADVIVCYMHWGAEYRREPDNNQKNLAKRLMECGVDVIIGGHPHMVQRAEWLSGTNQFGEKQETLCLYSLGNFLSFQREQYKDGGIIFDFTIQEQPDGSFSIINPSYLPVWVWMTGNSESTYTFNVVNIADYINNPPSGMSKSDYDKMITSYNDSVSIMNTGVGALLTK